MRDSTSGTLLILGAATGFGTIGIFGEVAAAINLELSTLLPLQFAFSTAIVASLALIRGWEFPGRDRKSLATIALGGGYAVTNLLFFISLHYLTAGLAAIVLYTYPTFVIILASFFLDEPITVRKVIALGLVTGGVVLVVGTETMDISQIGIGLALGAAICASVYTTGSRVVSASIGPRTLLIGVLAGATVSMFIFAIVVGRLSFPAGQDQWGVVFGLTIISTVIPHLLFYEGVSRLEASRVGVVSAAEPVVTVALGVLLLGETVTTFVLVGGVLVIGGVILIQSDKSPEFPRAADTHSQP